MTIRDVARRAGVSVATASRAMNGKQIVSEHTRERIRIASEELRFSPSPTARRLSLGRTMSVGVVSSYLTRPQAIERLRGIEAVLGDGELDLLLYNVESVQKRDHYLETLVGSRIATTGCSSCRCRRRRRMVPTLAGASIPVVFIDVHVPAVADAAACRR